MSALTDLFTALATKIRSKVGGAQTYTPTQMVSAIDDVYDAGVAAGTTPTQTKTVTAGTSAVTVTPDTGYALSSVTVNPTPSQSKSATPTTSAQTISPDSGKLLSHVDIASIPSQYKIPTMIIPGNTPTSMTAGEAYSPASNAYLIDGYTSITPSNTSPAPISSGMIKSEGSGYAISSYSSTSKTPSSTGTYFSSGWNRMTASGYAYSSQPKFATGSFNLTTSAQVTITLGFKPKYLCVYGGSTGNPICIYSEDVSTSKYYSGSSSSYLTNYNLPATLTNRINSITSDGFIMNKASSAGAGTYRYFAIG